MISGDSILEAYCAANIFSPFHTKNDKEGGCFAANESIHEKIFSLFLLSSGINAV